MILYQYPKTFVMKDGGRITIRPLRKSDESLLQNYFSRLPLNDRLCLSDDFSKVEVVNHWILDLDYNEILPLAAIDSGKMVGNANLIYNTIGWVRHQGQIQVTCDPAYRKKGLAKRLLENLIKIARHTGLEQLSAEVPMSFRQVRHLFENLGFHQASVLEGFVKGVNGEYDDLALMVKNLNADQLQHKDSASEPKSLVIPISQRRICPSEKGKKRFAL